MGKYVVVLDSVWIIFLFFEYQLLAFKFFLAYSLYVCINATGNDCSSDSNCVFIFDVQCGYVTFFPLYLFILSFYSDILGVVSFQGWIFIIHLLSSVFRLVKLLMDLMIAWHVLFLMEYNMIMVSILLVTLNLI